MLPIVLRVIFYKVLHDQALINSSTLSQAILCLPYRPPDTFAFLWPITCQALFPPQGLGMCCSFWLKHFSMALHVVDSFSSSAQLTGAISGHLI